MPDSLISMMHPPLARLQKAFLSLLSLSLIGSLQSSASAQTPMPLNWQFSPASGPMGVAFSPDGKLWAVKDSDGICLYSAATQLPYREISSSSGSVSDFRISPDSQKLAIETLSSTFAIRVEIWDITTGTYEGSILPSAQNSMTMAYSPDGKTLAIGGSNQNKTTKAYTGVLELWNAVSRTRTAILKTKATGIASVAYSQDGKFLAEAGSDGKTSSLELWNTKTKLLAKDLSLPELTSLDSVVFPPSGKTVVASGESSTTSTLNTWNLSDWNRTWTNGPNGNLFFLSPDGVQSVQYEVQSENYANRYSQATTANLYGTALQGKVRSWNVGWNGNGVSFSPDGKKIALIGTEYQWFGTGMSGAYEAADSFLIISDLTNSQADIHLTLNAYSNWWGGVFWQTPLFSPSGKLVLGGGANYGNANSATQLPTVNVWNAKDGSLSATRPAQGAGSFTAAFTPDEKMIALSAVNSLPNAVQFWSTKSNTLVNTITTDLKTGVIAFSPNSPVIAISGTSASGAGLVELWDYSANKLLQTLNTAANNGIGGLAYSTDGKQLSVAGSSLVSLNSWPPNGVAELWNPSNGKLIFELPTQETTVYGVTFSPDGKALVASGNLNSHGSFSGRVEIWSTATGKLTKNLLIEPGTLQVNSTQFSPNGKTLFAMTYGGTAPVQLFDTVIYQPIGYLTTNTNLADTSTSTLSPDGTQWAVASEILGLRVFKVPTPASEPIKSITFSPEKVVEGVSTTATVTLSKPAPAGGLTVEVELPANIAQAYTYPSAVFIAEGANSGLFEISGGGTGLDGTVNVTAMSGNYSLTRSFTVLPPTIESFTLSGATVVGGSTVTGTIRLINSSPVTTQIVWFASSNPDIAVPPSFAQFNPSTTTASFSIATNKVTAIQHVTLTAKIGSSTRTVTLKITPPKK